MNEVILTQDLVFVDQNEIYTDSYKIAREFKKEHKNVIRAIEEMECSKEFAKLNFELCFKINELQNGKPLKFYRISHGGAMMLIMGFTGKKAMEKKEKFIAAFEDMAKRLNRYDMYQRDLLTYNIEKDNASNNGRGLCRWKNIKPVLEAKLLEHEKELQPDWIDQLDKKKIH